MIKKQPIGRNKFRHMASKQPNKQEFFVVIVGCFLVGCLVFFDFDLNLLNLCLVGVLERLTIPLERLERAFDGMVATLS